MRVRLTGTDVFDGEQLFREGTVAELPDVTAERLLARKEAERVAEEGQQPAATSTAEDTRSGGSRLLQLANSQASEGPAEAGREKRPETAR